MCLIKRERYARREEGMNVSQGSLLFDVEIHLMEKMDGVMEIRYELNANAPCVKKDEMRTRDILVSLNNERKYGTDVQVPVNAPPGVVIVIGKEI